MTMKVDLPSSSLKIGITSFVPHSFSEPNTGVVRPHFHSSSNSVHCSRTPTCAGKDEKKHGHQFHSAKGILYLQCFYKLRRRGKNCAFLKNVEFITYANYWKFHRPKLLLSTSPFWSSPEKLVRPRPDLLPQPPFVHKSGSCRLQTDWNLQVLCSLSITKQVSFSAQRAKVFYPIVCQS